MAKAPGIQQRHQRSCRTNSGGACNCTTSWQAQVYDPVTRQKYSKTFRAQSDAKHWHRVTTAAVLGGASVRPKATPAVADALAEMLDRIDAGVVLDRSGKPYKPATARSYRSAADRYIVPSHLGSMRLGEVRRQHVQSFIDALREQGLQASTVRNKVDPLRVLFRRAVRDEVIGADPMMHLELPRSRGGRDSIVDPDGAERLLEVLSDAERPYWTAAFYSGLRRGELRALAWLDVDFTRGVVTVRASWDDVAGPVETKSVAGRRRVPLVGRLRAELLRHKLATGRDGADLVFGKSASVPFEPTTVRKRALRAWAPHGLTPLTTHEARHTFASYLIAAGANPKQLQTYMGHADVATTFNLYGHLMPNDERQTAKLLDDFLGLPAPAQAVASDAVAASDPAADGTGGTVTRMPSRDSVR